MSGMTVGACSTCAKQARMDTCSSQVMGVLAPSCKAVHACSTCACACTRSATPHPHSCSCVEAVPGLSPCACKSLAAVAAVAAAAAAAPTAAERHGPLPRWGAAAALRWAAGVAGHLRGQQ
eukprot:1088780-Pelagomonas_calceolata.AAC.1